MDSLKHSVRFFTPSEFLQPLLRPYLNADNKDYVNLCCSYSDPFSVSAASLPLHCVGKAEGAEHILGPVDKLCPRRAHENTACLPKRSHKSKSRPRFQPPEPIRTQHPTRSSAESHRRPSSKRTFSQRLSMAALIYICSCDRGRLRGSHLSVFIQSVINEKNHARAAGSFTLFQISATDQRPFI
jgi:hypothetical protein